jgi:oligopeptide/dipeptide ABC transporter ATP-binding protein
MDTTIEPAVVRSAPASQPLLEIRGLRTYFYTEAGVAKAVDGVDLDVRQGEVLGLVGESGSGKSVTALSVLRLIPDPPGRIVAGEIRFGGRDLLQLSWDEIRAIRGSDISMVFQEPMTSLNPVFTIGMQVTEVILAHEPHCSSLEAHERAAAMLTEVGIPDAIARMKQYPHHLSGGMRQRVMIAMALSCEPELLIADEPTTALDVTIQAQILELIKKLKHETGASVLLITHDLGVVAGMTDHVIVMYAGKVFEQATTSELFRFPGNPYTKGLLRSVPDPTAEQGKLYQIPGQPPDLARLGAGCPFAPRCDLAQEICQREFPPLVELNPGHLSLCHFAAEVYAESRSRAATEAGDT